MINIGTGNNYTPNNLTALPVSDASRPYVLAANTAQAVPIPAGAKYVMYSATGDFWAEEGNAAPAVPLTTPGADTRMELNPDSRWITPGTTQIGLVSAANQTVQVAFYG